ncbi:PAS domain S-box protein [Rufibacter sp. LB8]|uniref:sensor histidine kinase n=1 Tax=Rufibacter sp. LB8 TaxID=2777781 RepID=UPI00178C2C7D|nr:PAS domain S-box protein [Rufibacter sp. LB8]
MSEERKAAIGLAHDFSLLRQQAEKLQKPVSEVDVQNMAPHEVRRLIQELQIHQVELEMQNHQLQLATQDLEAATAKYKDLYHQSPFGYVTLDEHGLIEEANAKGVELLAADEKQLLSRRFSQFIHSDSLDAYYGFFKKMLLSNGPQTVDLRILATSGYAYYVHLEGILLRHDNHPNQVRIAFVDISEQKEAHLALSYKEATLSAVINSSLNAIQVFKAVRNQDGTLLDFEWVLLNKTAELFLDYTLDQLRSHKLMELYPALLPDGHFYTAIQVVENGQPATFTTRFSKNGKDHWLNCVAVKLDDGFVLTFEDVTQQRIANEKLQESQLLLSKMAEAMPDFIYVEDLVHGRNLYTNRNFLAFLGYTDADVKGHPRDLLDSLYHPEDAHLLFERRQRFAEVQDGKFLESLVRIKDKEGTWRNIFFRETVFKRGASGVPIQLVGTAQDITQKLKAEEDLRQKDNTISAILQNLPVIIWRIDKEGRITQAVGSGLQNIGYQDHELEGRLITEVNPSIVPNIETVLKGNTEVFVAQAEVNGETIYKQNYFLHDHATGGGIGFCLDITEQKKAEAEVQFQTMVLNQLLQNLPLVLALIDKQGNYQDIRGNGLRSVGIADNELVGKSIYKVFPFLRDNIQDVLSGQIRSFTAAFDYQGKQVYFQNYGFLDVQNNLGIAFGIDITDLQEAQEKLTLEKEFSENLLETHLHGIVALDNNLTVTAWNKAMEQFTSQERAGMLGRSLEQVLAGQAHGRLLQKLKRVLMGKPLTLTSFPFLPDERSFEISLTPLFTAEKEVSGILGIIRDTTSQKLKQTAETKHKLQQQKAIMDAVLTTQNEERKRIAEALHNSLAQLLYAAKLNLEEIKDKIPEKEDLKDPFEKVYSFLEGAIKETRTLAHELIPRVLEDFGLRSALKDLATRLSTGSFTVQCVITGFDTPTDYEIETHLFRFVQELLNNVMKHAEATEALVQVVDTGTAVRVRVADNGKGMPPSMLERASTSKGIGLTTIRYRVKLLQGTMQVHSAAGEGTTVTIEFPH